MIDLKLINGSESSLADMITKNKVSGKTVIVATFGIGVKQIKKLLWEFEEVTIIIDSTHSHWQKKLWKRVLKLNSMHDNLIIKMAAIHSKVAIIDNKIVIVTSANLSQNQFIESYVIGDMLEFSGIKEIINFFNSIPVNSIDWNRTELNGKKDELNNFDEFDVFDL